MPPSKLAGVLLATAVRMVEVGSLRALARSTRADGAVMFLTALATLALDLVKAVILGMIVAGALALRAIARSARVEEVALTADLSAGDHTEEEHRLLAEHIVAYRLDGPLFFAAAHRFLLELSEVADVRVVILRMSRVTTLDATGAHVLGDAITRLEHRGIVVLLSGIKPCHDQVLAILGVADHLRHDGLIFSDTPAAIAHARHHLHGQGMLQPKATSEALRP
ncbi:STAS domain-containing protein [Actinomadura sp. 6N118]|uniref:STAS domain-containing protein n=1 Tax=Actinomadura sp. 6N118 TaxID=3375151 RepID=UPI00378FC60B